MAWVTDVAWISHCCGCDVDCNSDLTPSLGTSIYLRCSQKKTNPDDFSEISLEKEKEKKKKKKEKKKEKKEKNAESKCLKSQINK